MYGQLVQHPEGLKVLEKGDVLSELLHKIHYPHFSSETDILHLKAALWAVVRGLKFIFSVCFTIKSNFFLCFLKIQQLEKILNNFYFNTFK